MAIKVSQQVGKTYSVQSLIVNIELFYVKRKTKKYDKTWRILLLLVLLQHGEIKSGKWKGCLILQTH